MSKKENRQITDYTRCLYSGVFPITLYRIKHRYIYTGREIKHLYWTEVFGENAIGNTVVVFRGPMFVEPEFICDNTERINAGKPEFNIVGPDLYHIIADFPQLGGGSQGLFKIYALQNLLIRIISAEIEGRFHIQLTLRESDIFYKKKKLNVAISRSSVTSSTMHLGINISTRTENQKFLIPSVIPAGALPELIGIKEEDFIQIIDNSLVMWINLINSIQNKVYKTVS